MLLVFHMCCGTLNSNQAKECECVMELPLTHFNGLTYGLLEYCEQNSLIFPFKALSYIWVVVSNRTGWKLLNSIAQGKIFLDRDKWFLT